MADVKRIDLVLDRITAENLNMGSWAAAKDDPTVNASCGTTMCFAGHACVAAGKTLKWEPTWDYKGNERVVTGYHAEQTTDGQDIEYFAQEWLDLDYDEADRIFYATGIGRDVELLRDHVDTVIKGGSAEQSRYDRNYYEDAI